MAKPPYRTGPYTRTFQLFGAPNKAVFAQWRKWYRCQDRLTPNPFQSYVERLIYTKDFSTTNVWSCLPAQELGAAGTSVATRAVTQNKALSSFQSQLWTNSSIATTLAEWEQSCSMIARRAGQLINVVKALKRGRLGDAYAYLEITKVNRKLNRKDKTFADLWLELHFGWEPLIKDIGSAVEVLQGSPPACMVVGRGTSKEKSLRFTGGGTQRDFVERDYTFSTKVKANVRVENPNLALANQMGFINPLSVAWELVPFSFVVDWFLPVGGFLNSFTSLAGLSLTNQCTTNRAFGRADFRRTTKADQTWYTADGPRYGATSFAMERVLGIPSFKLVFNDIKPPSLTRAATQVALLIQQLHR